MTKIAIVMGTRPEIIKFSSLIKLANKKNTDVIFTGQHYDYKMGLQFIDDLKLRKPDYVMKLSKESPPKQMAQIIAKLADRFESTKPDTVLVQGDTNTVLAASIASLKSNIPISHIEAGLRSFDWRMPEEHNRIATDHISELLFAPTKLSKKNLENEQVHGKIFVTGNTVIDAVEQNLKLAEKKSKINIVFDDFILTTFHRAENVDNKKTLGDIISALINSKENIVYPVHPRTMKRLDEFGLMNKIQNAKNVKLIDVVGYLDMLLLMKKCKFIVSDSGGIQEEATSPKIRKKVLIVRKSTDRPEAVSEKFAELVEVNLNAILKSIKNNVTNLEYPKKISPYGDGTASKKILKLINKHIH